MSVAITAAHDNKPTTGQQSQTPATFSFKVPQVPTGALKQRRVSLALPQAPRVAEGWNFRDDTGLNAQAESSTSVAAKMKKNKSAASATGSTAVGGSSSLPPDGDSNEEAGPSTKEKKPRKKWTMEETQMLVDGCNKHGVGNWKTILRDPTLSFDNRSPVDLKDRFRTYFPDAYKQHYPNAKTHLSSKVRSTLPDGSSLFEKTRSKRRRPFTEEEDRALKEGYEKYGTVWATIVKDYPIFQEQNRRSTDLRDRFRNAFPDLYQQAGYKPRNTKKRAAVDDQQLSSTGGPVRSRKRAYTHRGGTKSVPQSAVCSEDEESGDESESPSFSPFKAPPTPPSMNAVAAAVRDKTPSPEKATDDEDEEMDMLTLDPLAEALSLPDIGGHQEGEWSSGVNTPTHSTHWSTAAGSPTSSHLSADLPANSPFMPRGSNGNNNNFGMIGKSAWGNDWFSPNPRLDPSSSTVAQNSSYFEQSSPASPFSFHQLNYGVVDRYDLFPSTVPNDIASEGAGEAHSTFSDDDDSSLLFQGNRGFTHHSSSAGDLIFGARTHQGYYSSLSSAAVSAIGGGSSSFGFGGGLGLNFGANALASFQQQQQAQQHQNAGIHPMQLHAHGPSERNSAVGGGGGSGPDPLGIPLPDAMDEDLEDASSKSVLSDGALGQSQMKQSHRLSVPRAPMRASTTPQPQRHDQQIQATAEERETHPSLTVSSPAMSLDHSSNQFSLDDFVDLSNDLHTTPPATPLTHPRPMRRSSVSTVQHFGMLSDNNMSGPGSRMGRAEEFGGNDNSLHARSISVPPSEYRNSLYVPGTTSLDGGYASALVDFDSMHGMGPQPLDMSVLRQIHPFHSLMATATQQQQQPQQQVQQMSPGQGQHRPGPNAVQGPPGSRSDPGPMLLDVRGRSGHQGQRKDQVDSNDDDEDDQDGESDNRPQTPTLASRHLLSPSLSSRHLHAASPMATSLSSSSSSSASSHNSSSSSSSLSSALSLDDSWRTAFLSPNAPPSATSNASLAADIYNLPFLDLHYYGSGNGGMMGLHPGAMLSGGDDLSFIDMQAQALDLARSASVTTPSTAVFGSFTGMKVPPSQQQQQQQHLIAFGGHGSPTHLSSPVSPLHGPSMGQSMGQQQQHSHHLQQHQQPSPWSLSATANGLGSGKATLGRSQSHHRGQSQHVSATVNPADLGGPMSGVEGVRKKRLSWDGMSL
ncbi:hypothetical protein BKA70DRAFT_1389789 [Coprinopsis sp. MPI-PUGE-AT-0042]|nr:hypothetical protein BKA70DRAFT_1389789 [Coprinopsis sp. MPI-PUGE-AT-0042]